MSVVASLVFPVAAALFAPEGARINSLRVSGESVLFGALVAGMLIGAALAMRSRISRRPRMRWKLIGLLALADGLAAYLLFAYVKWIQMVLSV